MSSPRDLVRRFVPTSVRRGIRAKWSAIRPPTMIAGVGRGLRFDAGPSNPEYGRGDNELPVQKALEQHVRTGHSVLDVGANVGFFAVISARLVGPTGRVLAFEPVPENAALVRRNARLNGFGNVDVIEKAVSDVNGTGELVLAEYSGGAALSTAAAPPDAAGSIEVELVTIDAAVAKGEIPPPDVVKIDVEGVELAVLRGMSETLRHQRPVVICEIDDATPAGYREKHDACVDFVTSLGYRVDQLDASYPGGDWIVGHFVATPGTAADGIAGGR